MRADGLSSGVGCEFRDAGKDVKLGYLVDHWTKVTFDQPTRVYPRLVWNPKWTGEGTVTTVILEGDWWGVSL